MCQSPVPAESTNLVAGSFDAKIPSAKVDRYFPNKPLKFFRHNVFRALIFYEYLRQIFLNCLSVATRLSTVLRMQYSSVVTIPIWEPMFAKAFVNFLAKNMANVVLVLRVFSSFDCNISKSN
jgi:hypothetical protein